jgi:uncharacterized protein YlzI (FlbEa/FlbD family)
MITLTKLNDQEFALNHRMIETVAENPDTTIKLTNGNTYLVKEPMNEVLYQIRRYEKELRQGK